MGARDTQSRWRLILAGGNWTRLRSLTLQIAGDERLKQFCPVLSSATLCEDTQRRGALLPKTPSSGRACGPTYGVLVMSVWHGLSVITHLKPLHTARVEAAVAAPLWSPYRFVPPDHILAVVVRAHQRFYAPLRASPIPRRTF